MAYGKDFRLLALNKHKHGMKKSEICKTLEISRPTLDKWLSTNQLTASKTGPKKPRNYDKELLILHIELEPDMLLKDRCKLFNLSKSGLSAAFKKLNIVKNKKVSFILSDAIKNASHI